MSIQRILPQRFARQWTRRSQVKTIKFCSGCTVIIRPEMPIGADCDNCGLELREREDWIEGQFEDEEAAKLLEI